jgi:homoserine O-acetyltransferase/O-succinyltransferase
MWINVSRMQSVPPSDIRLERGSLNGDIVSAQYRLITQGLMIDHLRLVIGVSMGGMQTWMWGETFPSMMDALMPIGSQPTEIAGHNFLWRRVITEAIRNDPEWNGGNYAKQPSHWLSVLPLFNMMTNSRAKLYATAPTRAKASAFFDQIVDNGRQIYDANDFLYAFDSSWDYSPEPNLQKITAHLLALNFADDLINAAELRVVEQAVEKIPNGRSVTVRAPNPTVMLVNPIRRSGKRT